MDRESLERFLAEKIPDLDRRLRSRNLRRGPDVWLAVHDLLLALARRGELPDQPSDLAPYLAAVLCKSSGEQQEFPRIFEDCLEGRETPTEVELRPDPAAPATAERWWRRVRAFDRRVRRWSQLLLVLLAGIGLMFFFWPAPTIGPVPPPAPDLPAPTVAPEPGPAEGSALPLDDWVPPNLLPPPIPEAWRDALDLRRNLLLSLPPLGLALWLLWFYRRRKILEKDAPDAAGRMNHFRLQAGRESLFGGAETGRIFARLRLPRWRPTRRLDVAASVEATAHRAGYFTPRFR